MKSKETTMLNIFEGLSEKNQDILLLVANGVRIAQAESEKSNTPNNSPQQSA